MKHDHCDHPSTPAARRACRAQYRADLPPMQKNVSVDDCMDALVGLDRTSPTGYLGAPEASAKASKRRRRDVIPVDVEQLLQNAPETPGEEWPRWLVRPTTPEPGYVSWLSSEGVRRNGGIRPPGTEHMSAAKGSSKKNTKVRKESMLKDRPASEGFFSYEDQIYRVVKSKSSGALYARILSPDNAFGEYAPGVIKSLKESHRIPTPNFVHEAARAQRPAAPKVTQPGFYELNGNIYKVKQGRSGRLYALLVTEDDTRGTFASGIVFQLTEDMKLTEERAAAFGKATGQCLICNRTLTVQESIDRGIGPVCASKMGW